MAIVYRHIRIDKNEPFYIGKGKIRHRAYSSFGRSKHWSNIVSKTDYNVEIILDNLTMEEAGIKEKEFIKLYGRIEFGGTLCNLTDGGDGKEGFKCKLETKQKISKSNFGKKKSEEFKKNVANRLMGKSLSQETKLKMSKSRQGLKISEETKRKISLYNVGKKMSDETKIKMSNSAMNKVISDITKIKMSKSKIGKLLSDETKKKMSIAQSNRSEEHRKRISESKKIFWEKKKIIT
jgi:hypothetical protein